MRAAALSVVLKEIGSDSLIRREDERDNNAMAAADQHYVRPTGETLSLDNLTRANPIQSHRHVTRRSESSATPGSGIVDNFVAFSDTHAGKNKQP